MQQVENIRLHAKDLEDDAFIQAFEDLSLHPLSFDHEAHVRLAWVYLRKFNLIISIEKYTWGLKKLTRHYGLDGKYHETISWFYMILINERRTLMLATDFASFKKDNPDLFDSKSGVLQQYYSKSILASDFARNTFILPNPVPQ